MDCDNGFGKAPVDMFICRKCIHGKMKYAVAEQPSPSEMSFFSSWCTKAKCPSCAHVWYICRECTRVRVQLDTKKKLKTHNWRYHGKGMKHGGHDNYTKIGSNAGSEDGSSVPPGNFLPTLHEKNVKGLKKKPFTKNNQNSSSWCASILITWQLQYLSQNLFSTFLKSSNSEHKIE